MKKVSIEVLKSVKLASNFTLYEMVVSQLATIHSVNNMPSKIQIEKLRTLCTKILQPVRNHFNSPVKVKCAFTCVALNTFKNGAVNSQHIYAEAVDFYVSGVDIKKVALWIRNNLDFDILQYEYPNNDSSKAGWIHVSYVSADKNRHLDLTTESGLRKYMLSQNFSLYELTDSATARSHGIYNVPDEAGIEKLRQVCLNVLQPVRNHYNKAVNVSSGFRTPALNSLIKGSSKTSQHQKCEAVDYEIRGVDNGDLANWVAENLEYDQVILEYHGDDSNDPNDGWVHTSYVAPPKRNRKAKLKIDNKGTVRVSKF